MEEGTRPWDPIPAYANHEPHLDVVHLEESRHGTEQLVIDVASSWRLANSQEWARGAWRLTFTGVFAYRMRQVGYQGNLTLTRPAENRALWEMFPSAYLAECNALDGVMLPEGYHVQHYTIWGAEVYEVIAHAWRSEPLPDEWAHPFASWVPAP